MKKCLSLIVIVFLLGTPQTSRADLFGGDVVVLTQILAQAIMQLAKLKEMLGTASDQLNLIREINQGINDSLNLLRTLDPNVDPGLYKDWENTQDALSKLQAIYGTPVDSPDIQVQRDTDRGIAEAVTFNNNYYKWTKQLDEIGEAIKSQSHVVSPGGAQKLTAEAMGLLIQVMNQNLRAQATQLRLQAQGMAVQNRQAKEETKHYLDSTQDLKAAMQNERINFQVPRF
jgi:hypothetical protein